MAEKCEPRPSRFNRSILCELCQRTGRLTCVYTALVQGTPKINAAHVARLAGVGRAAVSNWRRRHEDFPQPVGGTASSPLFSLPEIAVWLRANGKSFEVSLGDLVWQRMRASVDDLRLGELVARVGAFLLFLRREPTAWRD